jgi:hypothetical protein
MPETPTFAKLGESIEASRAAGFEFLLTDVQLAHTMLARAAMTEDGETRERNIKNAGHACDTIRRLMGRLQLDESRQLRLDEGINSLESRLASLDRKRGKASRR